MGRRWWWCCGRGGLLRSWKTVSHNGALCVHTACSRAVVTLRGRPLLPTGPVWSAIIWCSFLSVALATLWQLSVFLCVFVCPLSGRCGRGDPVVGARTAAGRRVLNVPRFFSPLFQTSSSGYICLPTKGQPAWVTRSNGGEPGPVWRRRRPWAGLFSWEWCDLRQPGILDLTGDPSFSRSLRGSKPRPESSKMGKCDGRCTLLVICSLQLVSVFLYYEDIIRAACPHIGRHFCPPPLRIVPLKAMSCSCWGCRATFQAKIWKRGMGRFGVREVCRKKQTMWMLSTRGTRRPCLPWSWGMLLCPKIACLKCNKRVIWDTKHYFCAVCWCTGSSSVSGPGHCLLYWWCCVAEGFGP